MANAGLREAGTSDLWEYAAWGGTFITTCFTRRWVDSDPAVGLEVDLSQVLAHSYSGQSGAKGLHAILRCWGPYLNKTSKVIVEGHALHYRLSKNETLASLKVLTPSGVLPLAAPVVGAVAENDWWVQNVLYPGVLHLQTFPTNVSTIDTLQFKSTTAAAGGPYFLVDIAIGRGVKG